MYLQEMYVYSSYIVVDTSNPGRLAHPPVRSILPDNAGCKYCGHLYTVFTVH
jgi:hypothetical protein